MLSTPGCFTSVACQPDPGPPHPRRSLLVFLALFVCKHSAQLVADSIDSVQPGLTLMILQTVSLPADLFSWWLVLLHR